MFGAVNYKNAISRVPVAVFHAVDANTQHQQRNSGARSLCHPQQTSSGDEQVRQSAGHKQPIGVLTQAPVAYLAKAEDPLDDQEWMFNLGPHLRLGSILGALRIAQWAISTALFVGKVFCLGRLFTNHCTLPGIGRITPHPGFLAMQQVLQNLGVVHIRGGGRDRVNQFGFAVDADMCLHPKIPLVAFSRRMHLRIALFLTVLGGARRIDNRGVYDGAGVDLQAVVFKVLANQDKEFFTQVVGFQQMAEIENGRLVRDRLSPQVNTDETAHGTRIVQRFFKRRIRQIEPMLQEMDTKHPFQSDGRRLAALGKTVR